MTDTLALHVPADTSKPIRHIQLTDTGARALANLIGAKYIELVRTPVAETWLIVDEEGLYSTVPQVNRRVAGILYPGRIVGDVLIVGQQETEEGPDIGPLTPQQLHQLALLGVTPRRPAA